MSVATLRLAGRRPRPAGTRLGLLAALLVGVVLLNLNLGIVSLSPLDAVRTFTGSGTARDELVLFDIRLPRIVIAMLVGVGLALAGTILQAVTQNVLADPGILGINACAGVAIFLLFAFAGYGTDKSAFSPSPYLLPAAALVGAGLGAVLIYALAYKRGTVTPTRLLLVGLAVGFGATACIPAIAQNLPNSQVYEYAARWLEGDIAGAGWSYVIALAPWILVLAPLVFYKAQTLNVLSLGDHVATGLGIAVQRQQLVLVAMAVALAGSSVAAGGGIAFVGLVGPHLTRRLVGPNHRVLVPGAALVGAVLVVAADIVAQNALAPYQIPVGIIVALVGAPYFLYLLIRTRG